jgi:hypothetical protein
MIVAGRFQILGILGILRIVLSTTNMPQFSSVGNPCKESPKLDLKGKQLLGKERGWLRFIRI